LGLKGIWDQKGLKGLKGTLEERDNMESKDPKEIMEVRVTYDILIYILIYTAKMLSIIW
jgi:hypothetical protein